MTVADLHERMAQPWFDPAGLILVVEDAPAEVVAFHWTKVDPRASLTRSGEVYVVGVRPGIPGPRARRTGHALGLAHLPGSGCPRSAVRRRRQHRGPADLRAARIPQHHGGRACIRPVHRPTCQDEHMTATEPSRRPRPAACRGRRRRSGEHRQRGLHRERRPTETRTPSRGPPTAASCGRPHASARPPDERRRCRPTGSSTARSPGCSSTSGCSQLAADETVPLLERARFLAIFASNLDEFFMVRVAGLKRRIATGLAVRSAVGARAARGARADLAGRARAAGHAGRGLQRRGAPGPRGRGHHHRPLGRADRGRARPAQPSCSPTGVFPVLTPLAVDPAHPFPYISGLSLNLAVRAGQPAAPARSTSRGSRCRRCCPACCASSPSPASRRCRTCTHAVRAARGRHRRPPRPPLPGHGGARALHLPGHPQRGPRGRGGRRREPPHRPRARAHPAPLRAAGAPRGRRRHGRRTCSTCWSASSASPAPRSTGSRPRSTCAALNVIADLERSDLHFDPFVARTNPDLAPAESAKAARHLRGRSASKDILLQHPYDSFSTSVQAFIEQAAADPQVLAIKQTLYRTSGDSPDHRRPHRRRRGRQAGARGRRDQGALRRAEQHLLGAQARARRRARRLRHRRAEDPRQARAS